MLDKLLEKLRTLRQTGIIMGAAGAATALSTEVEWMPKGPAMLVLGSMASLLMFFLKKDYYRMNEAIARQAEEQLRLAMVTTNRFADVDANCAADKTLLMLQIADCVKVKEAGNSTTRIYSRINHESKRVTILETKLGMHDGPPKDDEPDDIEDLDKTPAMGTRVKE